MSQYGVPDKIGTTWDVWTTNLLPPVNGVIQQRHFNRNTAYLYVRVARADTTFVLSVGTDQTGPRVLIRRNADGLVIRLPTPASDFSAWTAPEFANIHNQNPRRIELWFSQSPQYESPDNLRPTLSDRSDVFNFPVDPAEYPGDNFQIHMTGEIPIRISAISGLAEEAGTLVGFRPVRLNSAGAVEVAGITNPIIVNSITDPVTVGAITTPRRDTFSAVFRLGGRPYGLSNAFGGAGTKQYATIYNPDTTKRARLLSCQVAMVSASAAAIVFVELRRITTQPATGNPDITAAPHDNATGAVCECKALPTTGGTVAGAIRAGVQYNMGITGAASVVNPPPATEWTELVPDFDRDNAIGDHLGEPYEMRPNQGEGYAVVFDCSAAATVVGFVRMTWTEE